MYDGDLLLYSSYYCGGGGSNDFTEIEYDSEKRPISISTGNDYTDSYRLTYQNGCVAKVIYHSYSDMDRYNDTGTVTYAYDASGKPSGINGDFTYVSTYGDVERTVNQTFRLTTYSGDGND